MRIDSGQQPAKDVVLFDHTWQQAERRGRFEDFTLVDHDAAFLQRSGTQSLQAVCR